MNDKVDMEDVNLKMLGALIPEDLFWDFKKKATERKENMREALMNAVMLYLEVNSNDK